MTRRPASGSALTRLRGMIIDDWHFVLRRAWSVRLLGASIVLDGCEAAINIAIKLQVTPPISPGWFSILAGVTTAAAAAARFIAQKKEA